MKISLRWVLKHIVPESIEKVHFDVKDLFTRANLAVVEIEKFSQLKINQSNIFAAKIIKIISGTLELFCNELNSAFSLNLPTQELPVTIGQILLIKVEEGKAEFLKLSDIGSDKESIMPAVSMSDAALGGAWKKDIFWEDIIFEIDNKSLTNRPDLWCHRGFAREFAMLLGATLIKPEELIKNIPTFEKQERNKLTDPETGFSITIAKPEGCSFYAALMLSGFVNKPCDPEMAFYLARTGFKPINMAVDLTNYVCADWGQPMHAFDKECIAQDGLVIREAIENEKLLTIDGRELSLDCLDLVVADGQKAVALAGIIGSSNSMIRPGTQNIILESATFHATTIRKSALRHKVRTESSARFEKTLDRSRAKEAILRFVFLAKKLDLSFKLGSNLLCLGQVEEPYQISIKHEFLEKKIGVSFSKDDVTESLTALGFTVKTNDDIDDTNTYEVMVPSWRVSKDIKIEEDIVEEVARCFGYNKIEPKLPVFCKQLDYERNIIGEIKDFFVYSMDMVEQYNYCFNDLDFCNSIGQDFQNDIFVINPVNNNTKYLVKSLIPGLLKNVSTNLTQDVALKFFEVAKTWGLNPDSTVAERDSFAGVLIGEKLDVFAAKSRLFQLFDFCGSSVDLLEVKPTTDASSVWENNTCLYDCFYNQAKVGRFGLIDKKLLQVLTTSLNKGFFFEFNFEFLNTLKPKEITYSSITSHPSQYFDISILAPLSSQGAEFAKVIKGGSQLIQSVKLVDTFTKKEWSDQRSLTYRVWVKGVHSSIAKDEVEAISKVCIDKLTELGVLIR